MTTGIPSGLGATIGIGQETTYNTGVTPTEWLYFKKEGFEFKKTSVVSEGLGAGRVQLGGRRVVPQVSVDGNIDLEVTERSMGLLFKNMLGSSATATQISSTTAYKQVHAMGTTLGSFTTQVGRPDVTGTIRPFTYTGCKITDWSLGVQAGQIADLQVTVDGAAATTATSYTAASFVNSAPLHFAEGLLTLGGTVSTSGGAASVSGGTTISSGGSYAGAVKAVTVKATNPMNVDRRTLGSLTKLAPLPNGFMAITGDLEIEFADLTTLYSVFAATTETTTAVEFSLVGAQIGTSGYYATVDVVLPQVFFDTDQTVVEGPDLVTAKVGFTALYDGTNTPVQITYTSADTSL